MIYPFKKYLGKHWYLIAIFSGLLPDFDFCFNILNKFLPISNIFMHGGIFHSFFVPFVLIIVYVILKNLKKINDKKIINYILFIAFGYFIHLILDLILGGGAYSLKLFYPLFDYGFRIHLLENIKEAYLFLDTILIIVLSIFYFLKNRK